MMRKLSFLLVVILAAVVVAEEPSYTSMPNWVGSKSGTVISIPALPETDALTFYTDLTTFEAANPGLTPEDYSNTLVPPNSAWADDGPLDYDTDNSLFALHTIVEGISMDELTGNQVAVLTPPFLGISSVCVGPDLFADDAVYNFTLPCRAFGSELLDLMGGGLCNIEVFGAGGSLGTTSVTTTPAGIFFGVSCDDEDIVSIEFICPGGEGELFANVQFGLPTPLERTTWAQLKTLFE